LEEREITNCSKIEPKQRETASAVSEILILRTSSAHPFVAIIMIICFFLGFPEYAFAAPTKNHEELEAGACSDPSPGGGTDGERIIGNAITKAESFCRPFGGVKTGDRVSHWNARSENGGLFCRVIGKIDCNGVAVNGGGNFGNLADTTCAPGEAMIGLHRGRNKFRCIKISGEQTRNWDSNGATQRRDMHACPIGQYAIDYNHGDNNLLCGYGASLGVNEEELRKCSKVRNQIPGGKGWTMCGCKPKNGQTYVVTGVRDDRNEVLCAPLK